MEDIRTRTVLLSVLLLTATLLPMQGAGAGLNGDGHLDIVTAAHFYSTTCLGDGTADFVCTELGTFPERGQDIGLGDLDADGDIDIVLAMTYSAPNESCLNDGAGSFTCGDLTADGLPDGGGNRSSFGAAMGDFDEDGTLDAVFANANTGTAEIDAKNRICLGDGTGMFDCADVEARQDYSADVAAGDLDGDGHLDLVFATNENGQFSSPNRLCFGDGEGGFTCENLPGGKRRSYGVALGDFDGDRDLDLVIANLAIDGSGRNQLCENDGSGSFSCSNISGHDERSQSIAVGDVDGDKDLDVLFANSERSRICRNRGGGDFKCRRRLPGPNGDLSIALGDFDEDGHLDAFGAGGATGEERICLGDGGGRFDCAPFPHSGGLRTSRATVVPPLCDGKVPTLIGTAGNDVIRGTAGDDVIWSGDGDDKVFGYGGDDTICLGEGNDRGVGGDGDDVVLGGFGDDTLLGNGGDDTLSGQAGEDVLRGHGGHDMAAGGPHDDLLIGGDGNDVLIGHGGTDHISGGAGTDVCSTETKSGCEA